MPSSGAAVRVDDRLTRAHSGMHRPALAAGVIRPESNPNARISNSQADGMPW
jgi:hypothetical protein